MAKILRIADIVEMTGFSRRTIYNLMDSGEFPKSIHLTRRSIGWPKDDVDAWLQSKIDNRDQGRAA
jgi:prophage regulatory protein